MIRALLTVLVGSLSLSLACSDGNTADPDAAPITLDARSTADASDPESCVGKLDGTPCGDPSASDCDGPDECLSGFCFSNFRSSGYPCGDPTDSECNQRDTCDGSGVCVVNVSPAGTPCGDSSEGECTSADECDGSGICQTNNLANGTPCGQANDSMCTNPDTCLEGQCTTNNEIDGAACEDCPLGAGSCAECLTGTCLNVCGGPYYLQAEASGTYRYDGYMFDVTALQPVAITTLSAKFTPGLHEIVVYYIEGGYQGYEDSAASWTQVGKTTLIYNDETPPTEVPININVELQAGERYGFYITSTGGTDMYSQYSSSSTEGNVFSSDENLQFHIGVGKSSPWGYTYRSRIFNGRINYVTNPPCSLPE